MNQDSSFPPMLPPSTELGALLFAVLPCLQETYRPLASFAYHMTELTRLKNIPSVPPLTGLSGIDALITDKDIMLRSLSFYGRMFRMPLLSTIATLLQGFQFYQAYKDILPGLISGMNSSGSPSPDLFSLLGGLPPDLMSSLFSGVSSGGLSNPTFSASPSKEADSNVPPSDNTTSPKVPNDTEHSMEFAPFSDSHVDSTSPATDASISENAVEPPTTEPYEASDTSPCTSDTLYDSLYAFLTPEQQKIYEQLMHTD